jgi:hypothetical protein
MRIKNPFLFLRTDRKKEGFWLGNTPQRRFLFLHLFILILTIPHNNCELNASPIITLQSE